MSIDWQVGYRELKYRAQLSLKLRERGIEIEEILSNHHFGSQFVGWYYFVTAILAAPDHWDRSGVAQEKVKIAEKITEEQHVPELVDKISARVLELGYKPQNGPLTSEGTPDDNSSNTKSS